MRTGTSLRPGISVAMAVTAAVALATSANALSGGDDDRRERRQGFSLRSIKGHWGYNTYSGTMLPPIVPTPTLAAAVGRISFDGHGGCSVAALVNLGGQTTPTQSSTCFYEVNPDGTGKAEAVFPGSPIVDPVPVAFIIVDDANEIRFMNTKFLVSAFTARRQ